MTLKTLAAAAALSVLATAGVNAATFDFSFDASGAVSGDTSLTAVGTLDINADPGDVFTSADISNLSILVDSDLFDSFFVTAPFLTSGSISDDGVDVDFISFFATPAPGAGFPSFGCNNVDCIGGGTNAFNGTDVSFVNFGTPEAARAAFEATAQVSAVPLPAGGMLLLSGFAGVAALKRRSSRTA